MNSKRIQELDALRGLAALGVLLFHYSYGYEATYQFTQQQPFSFRLGYLGVQLFFMISGFVIFLTVDRTQRPRDFVFSRFTRLYPTFWAGVVTTTVIVLVSNLPDTRRTPTEVLINLTMLQEFFEVPNVDGVYWTLTRELLFYGLVLAIFVLGLLRHVVPLAYGWLGLQLVANLMETHYGWFPWKIRFYLLTEYCHLFVAGIVFYRIYKENASRACYGLLAFATLNQFLLLDVVLPAGRFEESIYVVLLGALMWVVVRGKAKFLAVQPLLFLGSISYALYLIHQLLGFAIIRYFDLNNHSLWLGIGLSMATSIVVATLITWYVEQPSIAWLRNLYRQLENPKNIAAPPRQSQDSADAYESPLSTKEPTSKRASTSRVDSRENQTVEPTRKTIRRTPTNRE